MHRLFSLAALGLAASFSMASPTKSVAQEISAVQTFVRICYSQVPKLQGIRNMATQLGWVPLDAEAVRPFSEGTEADIAEAWDVELGERSYRLGLVQGPLTAEMKDEFPALAAARVTTCTLILDDTEASVSVANEMQELVGKPPESKDVKTDGHLVTTWSGGSDTVKVFLINKALESQNGGALSVTLIVEP